MSLAQTPEVRKLIGENSRRHLTGRVIPVGIRAKLSAALLGLKRTPEEIKKSADARRGVNRSSEFKRQRSEHQKRLWQNPEYRQNMVTNHRTPEYRERILRRKGVVA